MEEDSEGEDFTPFWVQSNTTNLRRAERLRHRFSSILLSSGLVVFLLLVTAVFFLGFVVPSTLSFSYQIFKPNNVKKSWDSLNVFLVLVAVVFGFLSRNSNKSGDKYSSENQAQKSYPIDAQKSHLSAPNQWYNSYSDYESKVEYKSPIVRRRNISSYPDLRESLSTHWISRDFQRRFNDDMNVDSGWISDLVQLHRRHRSLEEVDLLLRAAAATSQADDTVILDKLVKHSVEAEKSPPPSLPLPELQEKSKLSNESIGGHKKERSRRKVEKDTESVESDSVPKPAPPPPPAPPSPPHLKSNKRERKRGGSIGSSSATKDFLNSLYTKNKKKQRQKSVENLDLIHQTEAPLNFQLPPPLPPSASSQSVFQNLFLSKKHKRKRTIIVRVKSPPPPASPPPQPNAVLEQKIDSQIETLIAHQQAEPVKMDSFEKLEEISNSGGESPFHRAPRPPPPPPPIFKKPSWKFVVQGDYVRLDSNTSSLSDSPDPDGVDSDVTPHATHSGNEALQQPPPPPPLFCPSPDVNTKAESFITNFRAKLKLEKIDSMKKLGPSSLGPGPGPSNI